MMLGGGELKEVKEGNEVKEKRARTGPVRSYRDLLVYQQAYRLALNVSSFTRVLPRTEQFELGRQLRRCSTSVSANILEGCAKRNSPAEFKRHLLIASGELAETKFWIDLAVDEGFAERKVADELSNEYSKLGFMIHNLWKEWRKL
jgi:four helix bundle protein